MKLYRNGGYQALVRMRVSKTLRISYFRFRFWRLAHGFVYFSTAEKAVFRSCLQSVAMSDIRTEVRRFCKRIENIILNPKGEDEFLQALKDVNCLLEFGLEKETQLFQFSDTQTAKLFFQQTFYTQIGDVLLNKLSVDWMKLYFQHEQIRQNFDNFFLCTNTTGSFVILSKCLTESR